MKISFDIDTYKTRFLGGARQYLFFALLEFPISIGYGYGNQSSLWTAFGYGSNADVFPYLVRSTSLPDSSLEEIQVAYPGHPFKMAGGRSYGDWQVSFNVDEKGKILQVFNRWHNLIYDPVSQSASEPETYMVNQQLFLIDGTGEATVGYTLVNAWPKAISQTGLDYASSDIATVDVTFSYQFFQLHKMDVETDAQKKILKSAFNRLTGSAFSLPRI